MFNLATICNLYGYDEVFKDIEINEKLDKDTLINTILDSCAMYEPIYPELEILNMKIKVFFKKHKIEFDKLVYLYNLQYNNDYNPIWNKDGKKTHTETSKRIKDNTLDNTTSKNTTMNNLIKDSNEETHQVSAFDSNTFSNDRNSTSTDTRDETGKEDYNGNENTIGNEQENIELKIEDFEQGNIGVTTTASMINEEISLQKNFNAYEIIATMFYDELMLHVAYTNQLPY